MSRLFKTLISLLVTLPAAVLFSILCYFLVLNYEEWYSTFKGPILGLLTLILGLYTLVSPLVIYNYLGRVGIKPTLTRYLVRPLIYGLPILALITYFISSFSSNYLKVMASLIAMMLVFWGMIRSEWLLEKYGRDQFYIPWNSNK